MLDCISGHSLRHATSAGDYGNAMLAGISARPPPYQTDDNSSTWSVVARSRSNRCSKSMIASSPITIVTSQQQTFGLAADWLGVSRVLYNNSRAACIKTNSALHRLIVNLLVRSLDSTTSVRCCLSSSVFYRESRRLRSVSLGNNSILHNLSGAKAACHKC